MLYTPLILLILKKSTSFTSKGIYIKMEIALSCKDCLDSKWKIIFNFDERRIDVSKMLFLWLTRAIDVNCPHTNWFMLYLAILLTLKISHALSQREDGDRNCFQKIVLLFFLTRQWTIGVTLEEKVRCNGLCFCQDCIPYQPVEGNKWKQSKFQLPRVCNVETFVA